MEQHTYKVRLAFRFDSSSKDTLNTNARSYPSAGGDALAYASSGFVFSQNLSVSHAIQIVALFVIRVTTATARGGSCIGVSSALDISTRNSPEGLPIRGVNAVSERPLLNNRAHEDEGKLGKTLDSHQRYASCANAEPGPRKSQICFSNVKTKNALKFDWAAFLTRRLS